MFGAIGRCASRNPITGIAGCCARAASGHAAAPPRRLMNSRRRISAPKLRGQHCIGSNEYFDRGSNRHQNHCRSAQPMSQMGQKLRLPRCNIDGRFSSISRHTIACSNRAVLQAIIEGEDHAFREPVLVRAVPVRTPRHKRVPKMPSNLIARRHASRLNPIPGPAELGRQGVQLAPPSCHPSIAKAALSIARAATAEIACFFDESASIFQANFSSIFNGLR